MLFFDYLYYIVLRYDQGENSFGKFDYGCFTRLGAMMSASPTMLIALMTPVSLLMAFFRLDNAFIPLCQRSGLPCGGGALALLVSIAVLILIERFWLFPRLSRSQKIFWDYGRPNPVKNAVFCTLTGLPFIVPFLLSDSHPLVSIVLWSAIVLFTTYSLKLFILHKQE